MPRKSHQPVRMCIVCRERFPQTSLLRLQCKEGLLTLHGDGGRSFYLCAGCYGHKKTPGMLMRQCKCGTPEMLMNRLKEIIVNDG